MKTKLLIIEALEKKDCFVSELSRILSFKQSTICVHLKELEKKGFVLGLNISDKNKKMYTLTIKGQLLYDNNSFENFFNLEKALRK